VKARRVLALVAFALVLLSQQLGMAHALSHVATDAGSVQKKQLPAELQCGQCLAFAAIGSGLPGSPPSFHAPPLEAVAAIAPASRPGFPAPYRAFDSRAPPRLI
jgi:hypothetical protein